MLRIAIGNGLSREVWRPSWIGFGPLRILEFYASTEGNVWLYNVEGKIGSIGRVPPYLALRDPIALARFDHESQMPSATQSGFCERCADSEIGEALGRIGKDPGARFEGYSEDIETEKKFCATCSRSATRGCGQAISCGATPDGFYTFVDRIGDTFRWKGENVATFEVASVLRACPGVQDAIVYGVAVPGADGRAGMALLKIDEKFDLDATFRAARNIAEIRPAALLAPRHRDRDHRDLQTEAKSLCRSGL